jgi:hypothetical protein
MQRRLRSPHSMALNLVAARSRSTKHVPAKAVAVAAVDSVAVVVVNVAPAVVVAAAVDTAAAAAVVVVADVIVATNLAHTY